MKYQGLNSKHGLLAAALFVVLPTLSVADIMTTCKPEIGTYCSDVRNGKGRIAACLFAYSGNLGGACAKDVKALSNSKSMARVIPAGISDLKGSSYDAELRAACTSDAAKLCPGVNTEDEGVLACLYSRDNKLSATCKKTGKRVLSQIK